jgi:hypothetical protein
MMRPCSPEMRPSSAARVAPCSTFQPTAILLAAAKPDDVQVQLNGHELIRRPTIAWSVRLAVNQCRVTLPFIARDMLDRGAASAELLGVDRDGSPAATCRCKSPRGGGSIIGLLRRL